MIDDVNEFRSGVRVFILSPDKVVLDGMITGTDNNLFRVDTADGRTFYRDQTQIFQNEKMVRAKQFIFKYKLKLRTGQSLDDAWNSEDPEIVDLAVEHWPEELL